VVAVDYQPVTQDRLHEAETAFENLAHGDDEIADAAAYMQARLYQVHFQQHDFVRAAALFRALAERHPDSHWAQLGLVKLGLLLLYTLPEPSNPPQRIAAASALLSRVHEEKLQRDLHLQIARAGTFYDQPLDTVLPHLIEVDRIGGLVGQAPEDLAISLGELSLRAGHYEQARKYFEAYLRIQPLNLRSVTVRRRLEDLDALEAKAKGGRP
jgi:tetratricopeptide (TPR) repeat protein